MPFKPKEKRHSLGGHPINLSGFHLPGALLLVSLSRSLGIPIDLAKRIFLQSADPDIEGSEVRQDLFFCPGIPQPDGPVKDRPNAGLVIAGVRAEVTQPLKLTYEPRCLFR